MFGLFWICTAVCRSRDFRLLIIRTPCIAFTRRLFWRCLFRNETCCPAPSPVLFFSPTCPVRLPFLPLILFHLYPPPTAPPPPFYSSSGVHIYSRCIICVLWMTKLAAILTPQSAEWIGKYRAVEERSIHPSTFTPVAVRVLAETTFSSAKTALCTCKKNAHQL